MCLQGAGDFSQGGCKDSADFCCFSGCSCPTVARALVSAVVLPVDLIWRDAVLPYSQADLSTPAHLLLEALELAS